MNKRTEIIIIVLVFVGWLNGFVNIKKSHKIRLSPLAWAQNKLTSSSESPLTGFHYKKVEISTIH